MVLFYNGTELGVAENRLLAGAIEVTPTTIGVGTLSNNAVTLKHSHLINYIWTIPANSVEDFGNGGANRTIAFSIQIQSITLSCPDIIFLFSNFTTSRFSHSSLVVSCSHNIPLQYNSSKAIPLSGSFGILTSSQEKP